MILTENKERVRFLKFATVGAMGAVIDFGVMNMMTHLFDMKLVYAGTISFICAVISNFTLNRYWTYPDSRSTSFSSSVGHVLSCQCGGHRLPHSHPALRGTTYGSICVKTWHLIYATDTTISWPEMPRWRLPLELS